jgi:hypothetical protein
MPIEVVVDPDVFLLPVGAVEGAAAKYLRSVRAWGRLMRIAPKRFVTSRETVFAIAQSGKFPTVQGVARLIRDANVSGYSAVDVYNVLRGVLERRPYLEEHLAVTSVVVRRGVVSPTALCIRVGTNVGAVFRDALWCAAVAIWLGEQGAELCIGTWRLPSSDENGATAANTVQIAGAVEMYEIRGDLHEGRVDIEVVLPIMLPAAFTDDVPWQELYRDPVAATHRACHELLDMDDERIQTLGEVRVGAGFVKSVEECNFVNEPALLKRLFFLAANALAKTLFRVNGADLHPVRTSAAAEAPQVARDDGGKLWRCTITKHGAGFRLQYWSLPGNVVELSEVMHEHDV